MLHVVSSHEGIEILKVLWLVCPPTKRIADIPEEAQVNASFPSALTAAAIVLHTKVFPPPPALSRNTNFPHSFIAESNTVS